MERPRKRRYNEASTVVIEPSEWAALPSFEDSGYSGSSDEDVQVVPPRSTEADEQYKTDAIEQLKRKVAELTAELEATKTELQATKNELGRSKLQHLDRRRMDGSDVGPPRRSGRKLRRLDNDGGQFGRRSGGGGGFRGGRGVSLAVISPPPL
ncbi:hypothetical protein AAVH_35602 [Aphelenchoides avenae]|nr:hypothetical protein AAVH_35602 [Aphelenchus avenae]